MEMIVITGPTASGKTARAVSLARLTDGEIISADSRQVYRDMDIGSGKDISEYGNTPYWMIDVAEAGEVFNLYRYLDGARRAIDDISSRGKLPIVCGGSGMYVEALVRGTRLPEVPENPPLREALSGKSLDELRDILAGMKTLHNTTDTDTPARAIRAIEIQTYYDANPELAPAIGSAEPNEGSPAHQPLIIIVDVDRETRRERITRRLDLRLKEGMVEEVRKLLDRGIPPEILINYGLEYRFLTRYILGELTYDEMRRQLEIAIHQFAKRQMTWFRGMERRGLKVNYLSGSLSDEEFNARVLDLYRRQ